MTFEQAVQKFRLALTEGRNAPCTATTIAGYLRNIHRLQREVGGLLGPDAEQRLVKWRHGEQRRLERKQIGVSKIRGDVAVLRTFYDALGFAGDANPARAIRSLPKEKRLPRPMPLHLIQQLAASIPLDTPDGLRDRCMIEFYYHGLRNHEVASIDTTSVSYDPGEETFTVRVVGKGRKEELSMLSPRAAPVLALYLVRTFSTPEDQAEWEQDLAGEAPEKRALGMAQRVLGRLALEDDRPLFTVNGRRFTVRDANRMFSARRTVAGISAEFGPHSLRHAFGTQLLEAGTDLRVVQELMRHEDIRTTTLYTKVSKGLKLNAVSRLPALAGATPDA